MANPSSAMPPCGLSCTLSSLNSSSCAPTDTPCFCRDTVFASVFTKCVLANCTIKEGLVVKNETWSSCGLPEANSDRLILALNVGIFSLQSVVVALRMLCRLVRIAPWGLDDATIAIAYLVVSGFVGASVIEQRNGLGRDIWTLTPDQITSFLRVFWVFSTLYCFVIAMIKISICFLYLRLFPDERFKRVVWATQVFNVALLASFIVANVLECRPLHFFWDGWDGEHQGTCINISALAWSHAAINIALDLWMLGLPASQVWRLNVSWKRKASIMTMFGLGIFLTIVSVIRLQNLASFGKTTNPTVAYLDPAIWSTVEIAAGLIVACLPAARLFIVRYIPRLTSSILSRASKHTGTHSTELSKRSGNVELGHIHQHEVRPGGVEKNRKVDIHNPDKGGAEEIEHAGRGTVRSSLRASDLDRNRCYSMRVTITSAGRFLTEDDEILAFGSPGKDHDGDDAPVEPPVQLPAALGSADDLLSASARRPGEYLGVPEGLLASTPPTSHI